MSWNTRILYLYSTLRKWVRKLVMRGNQLRFQASQGLGKPVIHLQHSNVYIMGICIPPLLVGFSFSFTNLFVFLLSGITGFLPKEKSIFSLLIRRIDVGYGDGKLTDSGFKLHGFMYRHCWCMLMLIVCHLLTVSTGDCLTIFSLNDNCNRTTPWGFYEIVPILLGISTLLHILQIFVSNLPSFCHCICEVFDIYKTFSDE